MRRILLLAVFLASPLAAQNFGVTEDSELQPLPDMSEPVEETIGGGIVVEQLSPAQRENLQLTPTRPRSAPIVRVRAAPGAILRGLDKISGDVTDLELAIGDSARVGRLTVELIECRVPAENPTGDAYAYLRVMAEGLEDPAFEGWMIASSPALSALDHPRYDVWVIRCNMR